MAMKIDVQSRDLPKVRKQAASMRIDVDARYHSETDESHVDRVTVNFIRHRLTNYDRLLISGHDYDEVRAAILRKIFEVYPVLIRECARQGADMRGFKFKLVAGDRGILQRVWSENAVLTASAALPCPAPLLGRGNSPTPRRNADG